MSSSSLLRLVAKKVVFTAPASTEAEHIRSTIASFERARHRVLRNSHLLLFFAASRARKVEVQ